MRLSHNQNCLNAKSKPYLVLLMLGPYLKSVVRMNCSKTFLNIIFTSFLFKNILNQNFNTKISVKTSLLHRQRGKIHKVSVPLSVELISFFPPKPLLTWYPWKIVSDRCWLFNNNPKVSLFHAIVQLMFLMKILFTHYILLFSHFDFANYRCTQFSCCCRRLQC